MDEVTSRIVRHALNGDKASIAWVVQRFTPLFTAFARTKRGTGELFDPEELVASAWLALLKRRGELDWKETDRFTPRLVGWMKITMQRLARDFRERAAHRPQPVQIVRDGDSSTGFPEPAAEWRTASQKAALSEIGAKISVELDKLGAKKRDIFLRRVIGEEPWNEIGAAHRMRPNTCAVWFHQSVESLRGFFPADVVDDWLSLL